MPQAMENMLQMILIKYSKNKGVNYVEIIYKVKLSFSFICFSHIWMIAMYLYTI